MGFTAGRFNVRILMTRTNKCQCAPIKSFGKKHLEDVVPEVQTRESVAHWCGVDTRIGTLTCVLEENYCFDAEMYADELQLDEQIDFREDHRSKLHIPLCRGAPTNVR